jgi:N-acyl-D-amino-acid deacylase
MYSLLIKNAKVIDGTGAPGQILDVAVEGDKIVNVDNHINIKAQTIIDAAGKILAPGFIDIQNHSDSYWQIFDNPQFGSLITQGFTSILIGHCGGSLAPLLSKDALLAIQKWHNLTGVNINWRSFSEYLEELSKKRFACNVASLVGYSTLRRGIVADQVRGLEKEELEIIKKTLRESLENGAFGLSSGLSYSHEIIIKELELFELAKIVSETGALFSVHLRNETDEIVEALEETLDIARNSGVNLKISHLKIRSRTNWEMLPQALERIDTAFHKGTNVHFDLYPYDTVWQVLYSYLPRWATQGGRAIMLKHLSDPVDRNKILVHLNNSPTSFAKLMVASTSNKLNFTGKTLGQIAKNLEMPSEQALLHLIQSGGSEILVFDQDLDPEAINQLLVHPLSFVATDGAGFNTGHKDKLVHPRCFGTAPKFLHWAKNSGLSLEEAIKKLTAGPAKKAGIKNRGEIKIGNFADLIVFDEAKLKDLATYDNPYVYSQGMEYVFVNGKAVIAEGKISGELPGYVLRKS